MDAGLNNLLNTVRESHRAAASHFTPELWAAIAVLAAILAWIVVPL